MNKKEKEKLLSDLESVYARLKMFYEGDIDYEDKLDDEIHEFYMKIHFM